MICDASFNEIFPNGILNYTIGKKKHNYTFAALPTRGVPSNKKMQGDTLENLMAKCKNVNLCKDLITLLIYGAASVSPRASSVLYKCNAYEYLGQETLIKKYVRQNYIRVSRIVSGREAADLGNVAQNYAAHYLADHLGKVGLKKSQYDIHTANPDKDVAVEGYVVKLKSER